MEPTTKIVMGPPPILDKLYEKIPGAEGESFYTAYDHTIYATNTSEPPQEELIVHEEVHFKQQDEFAGSVDAWWEKYLDDAAFRLDMEIEAYATQVAYHQDPANRKRCLDWAAWSISGPLYGRILNYQEAKGALKLKLDSLETERTSLPTSDKNEQSS